MKHLILAMALSGAITGVASAAAPFYINDGIVNDSPVIDATNFVNNGTFNAGLTVVSGPGGVLVGGGGIGGFSLYDFSSVENFTNRSIMSAFPGFEFDNAPASSGVRKMSKSFYNAGFAANGFNASISSTLQMIISATNILNRGLLSVGSYGSLSLQGKTVDLGLGVLENADLFSSIGLTNVIGFITGVGAQRTFDAYWGFGTNRYDPTLNALNIWPRTPAHQVISLYSLAASFYLTNNGNVLNLIDFGLNTNSSVTSAQFINEAGTNRTVQIVFVRCNAFTNNPNVTPRIYSVGGSPFSLGNAVVEWAAAATNPAGGTVTNFLYLTDTYGALTTNAYYTNYPAAPAGSFFPTPPFTYQPQNFSLQVSTVPLYNSFFLGTNAYTQPTSDFWGPPTFTNQYAAWRVAMDPTLIDVADPEDSRVAPGRIEIVADKSLDISQARVDAGTYLRLQATNHFVTPTNNTTVIAPYSDISLGTSNGLLNVSRVLVPVIPRISCDVAMYSAVWTNNVFFNGSTNPVPFHVLYVDSTVSGSILAQQMDVNLRGTNLIIGDAFNVLKTLTLNADRLTITSNGAINVSATTFNWQDSATHLRSVTNEGTITAANSLYFRRYTNGAAKPYGDFVNSGIITSAGNVVWATNVVNVGSISSLYGPIDMTGTTNMTLLAGLLSAPQSDISLASRVLTISNETIVTGRKLTLSVTNALRAGTNAWLVNDGVNVPVKPATGDLLNTTIYSLGQASSSTYHVWPGMDRGRTVAGFADNMALGMLTLDGSPANVTFAFAAAGSTSNALYVDRLELTNFSGTLDGAGNLSQLSIGNNMVIYYAQATINGASAAEFLDGKNGGRLRWVSRYAGAFSGTNVVYPDGSTNFLNAALVTSCNLDSDNDTIPNCIDPSPVLLLQQARLTAKLVNTPTPALSLSWTTVGWATNRFYTATNMRSPSWQFYTNIISPPQYGPPFTKEFIVPLSSSRFYKVDVIAPQQ